MPFSTNTSREARTSFARVFSLRRVPADSGSGSNSSVMAPRAGCEGRAEHDGRYGVSPISPSRTSLKALRMSGYYRADTLVYRMRGRLDGAIPRPAVLVLEVACP